MDGIADLVFAGDESLDWFGGPIDLAGDVNGDGYTDILIGAPAPYKSGAPGYSYLYFGGPSIDNTADLVLTGEVDNDRFGSVGRIIGDVNRDGFDDFMVGAFGNDTGGTDAGRAYIYFGKPVPDAIPDIVLTGEAAGDNFGVLVTSVGDINGDGCPDFAVGAYRSDAAGTDAGRAYVFSVPSEITFDIKPRSCPNPFNIAWLSNIDRGNENDYAKPKKGGVMPAAIAGSERFDVTEIDLSTLLLEGIGPLRSSLEDVTRPVSGTGECACTTAGPDGFLDLTLKFSRLEVAGVLGDVEHGDVVKLTITGELLDGTPFEAGDCITILSKHPEPQMTTESDDVELGPAIPNPFNPSTTINYVLPVGCRVTLDIYDSSGRLVARLLSREEQPKGSHSVEWRGLDERGRPVSSGVYFYRLQTGKETMARKMVLLK